MARVANIADRAPKRAPSLAPPNNMPGTKLPSLHDGEHRALYVSLRSEAAVPRAQRDLSVIAILIPVAKRQHSTNITTITRAAISYPVNPSR